MIRHLPNVLTSLNLVTGVAGIINLFQGDYTNTVFFIVLAGLFDFLDGFVAKRLKVAGELGKQLDSLADMVTFGVLPSLYLFQLSFSLGNPVWVGYAALLVAVFSAIRLARFNIDDRQTDKFIGLPTPANALLLATFAQLPIYVVNYSVLVVSMALLSSFLLVSPIEMIALKFKDFGWSSNPYRYILLAGIVLLFLVFGWLALPLIIPFYILLSIVSSVWAFGS
ncbi:MAG: CDP-diacylglycerol--serine O-phosphatidyltransferase [Cyclobacteriaceae bacterium]|nr:CDP-diacylglycerol--serine O-phosphatidyltransferase [Cyclobacteriaceae bacterium]